MAAASFFQLTKRKGSEPHFVSGLFTTLVTMGVSVKYIMLGSVTVAQHEPGSWDPCMFL